MKLEERLKTLSRLNANPTFINKQLYRMLYNKDFYILAYERLKTNKGAMTAGSNPKGNIDGINMDIINKIIHQLKEESYQPKPSKRTYITKTNGKLRPLGLPNFRDKLVQECISIILTCIYDSNENPTFSEDSFGFRPGKGCHLALKKGKNAFRGVIWCIKADVKGFFDNVNHEILVNLLKRRIDDTRFIRLIWKFLRCGIVEDGQLSKPRKGTPQGGNLSPILSNIYLHEFDMFINELKKTHGVKTEVCPKYHNICCLLYHARKRLKNSNKATDKLFNHKKTEVERLRKLQLNTPSRRVLNTNKVDLSYIRYADDWVLGLRCTKKMANLIYSQCEQFFKESLKLEWCKDKSKLVRSTKEDVEFLGVYMAFVSKRQEKIKIKKLSKSIKGTRKVVHMNFMRYVMKKADVCKSLAAKGFLDGNFNPISCKRLVNFDVFEIAKVYKSMMTGISNYYGFVHNIATLNFIHYKLFISLCKTLAHKFKSCKAKIMKKYGGRILTFEGKGKAKPITIPMYGGHTRDLENFMINVIKKDTQNFKVYHNTITSSWLNLNKCCICNKEGYIEMHHVKHIRKIGQKVKGFELVLRRINRKQIPVCLSCHWRIHNGLYDGLNLDKVANKVMKELGIIKWEDRNLTPQEQALIK